MGMERTKDRDRIMLSGEVHHWRLDPMRWGTILDRVAGLGFHQVSTYLPWCVHERGPGEFDFTVERDIAAFLELAAARRLRVLVRPGPDTGAELQTSGWPRRVLDDPRCQALRPNGRPYLLATATHHAFMPSYAARATLDEVAGWYDAVVPVIAPYQAPNGPVVGCQVDNEIGYHFQPHPYALDYHPEALTAWRAWLLERHGSLDSVNAAYGTSCTRPEDLEPPRDGTDTPELRRTDWVTWKEVHLRDALATLGGMLRERGITVPLVHNDYPRTQTPQDTGALERTGTVDVAAGDIYTTKEGGRFARDYVRHLAGSTHTATLGEVGAGWLALPWLLPMDVGPADEQHVTLRTLAAGAREINVYMLVERDRWYGSPVSAHGVRREPAASLYPRLRRLVDDLGWSELRRTAPVLVVENRTERRRIAARQILGEALPCFPQLLPIDRRLAEPEDPEADELARWETGLSEALERAGVDHDRASSSALGDLTTYRLVVLPTLDALDPGVWTRLRQAAAAGVRVAVGPRVPTLDEHLRPRTFEDEGITLLAAPGDAAALAPEPPFRCEAEAVDLHHLTGGGREVLVTVNASAEPLEAKVSFDGTLRLAGRWTTARAQGTGSVAVTLAPWEIQVWEVTR